MSGFIGGWRQFPHKSVVQITVTFNVFHFIVTRKSASFPPPWECPPINCKLVLLRVSRRNVREGRQESVSKSYFGKNSNNRSCHYA